MTSKVPPGWADEDDFSSLPWRWAIYNAHEPLPAQEFGVIRDKEDEPTPIHVTYWWQVEALLALQSEYRQIESLLAEANIELRNDE